MVHPPHLFPKGKILLQLPAVKIPIVTYMYHSSCTKCVHLAKGQLPAYFTGPRGQFHLKTKTLEFVKARNNSWAC